jgi:superfamily II RNA helicase
MQHIRDGNHVLVAAHTSAGKTSIAEYSIGFFLNKNKKIIFTSPIKALSNQKYDDFRDKAKKQLFNCQVEEVGIITGDVQQNPDAKIIVATTEIIRNYLVKNKSFFEDVGCVVFDEVHYINDPDRGTVWEESIALMPEGICMVMLSATIPSPERFTNWISDIKNHTVGLVTTNYRPTPLEHYIYWEKELHPLFDRSEHRDVYARVLKERKRAELGGKNKKTFNKISFLNEAVQCLRNSDKLPAFFFCFSRRLCLTYAKSIQIPLVSGEESAKASNRFDTLVARNLNKHNHHLPQVQDLKCLIAKGIAIHHSGLLPILKEIVEILFSEGYIKVLFVTETFAVGINMACRTVVFTELEKHDSRGFNLIRSDAYQQMAGRAGRRGIDTSGNVVILGLTRLLEAGDLFNMIRGPKQQIQSKFRLDGQFVLNTIESKCDPRDVIKKTLRHVELQTIADQCAKEAEEAFENARSIAEAYTMEKHQEDDFNEYCKILHKIKNAKQRKQIKRMQKQVREILETHPDWEDKKKIKEKVAVVESEAHALYRDYRGAEEYMQEQTETILQFLTNEDYLMKEMNRLTVRGVCCCQFRECPPFLTTELILRRELESLKTPQEFAAGIASLIEKKEYDGSVYPGNVPKSVASMTEKAQTIFQFLRAKHEGCGLYLEEFKEGASAVLPEYAFLWTNEDQYTLRHIHSVASNCIDDGDFVRSMLKLYNMCVEIQTVASILQSPIENTVSQIPALLLRDLVKVDSIYLRESR